MVSAIIRFFYAIWDAIKAFKNLVAVSKKRDDESNIADAIARKQRKDARNNKIFADILKAPGDTDNED